MTLSYSNYFLLCDTNKTSQNGLNTVCKMQNKSLRVTKSINRWKDEVTKANIWLN